MAHRVGAINTKVLNGNGVEGNFMQDLIEIRLEMGVQILIKELCKKYV